MQLKQAHEMEIAKHVLDLVPLTLALFAEWQLALQSSHHALFEEEGAALLQTSPFQFLQGILYLQTTSLLQEQQKLPNLRRFKIEGRSISYY